MFDRPRCRDWSPLSTQQLRLRSLIQISGHNIIVPERHPPTLAPSSAPVDRGRSKCTVYFTLHQTPHSAPFYTSEKLDLHRNVLWAEIDCPATIKSSLRSVCVRVWEHTGPSGVSVIDAGRLLSSGTKVPHDSEEKEDDDEEQQQQQQQEDPQTSDKPNQPTTNTDRMLFAWGVYFSGLVPLARRNEKRLQANTLVFQLHGGYFTSAACILEPEQRRSAVSGTVNEGTIPKTVPYASGPAAAGQPTYSPSATIPIVGSGRRGATGGAGGRTNTADNVLHCDTSNNSSPLASGAPQFSYQTPSSASPNQWNFANGGLLLGVEGRLDKLSVSPVVSNGGSSIGTGPFPHARSASPSTPISWTEPTETSLKLRYLVMEFLPAEVRPSYDVARLLAIQERQRRIRYEADSAKTLTERICMKSAYCLNMELFSSKHPVYRTGINQGRTGGMGKQLSKLLYQEREPIDPAVLLRGQELRRHIERARFRCRLLAQERDRIGIGMQQLRNRLNAACDSNIERESALMERYRTYGREKEQLYQQKMAYASQKDSVREVFGKMLLVRHRLLKGLNEIYYIKTTNQGIYTINDVPLPNAESYSDSTPALALSVALGFVAHAVMMCSSFLDIPLRNTIKYDGSRSKIVDHIKLLPTMDRDFPLHCRSGPAPNALLYGVYLLNQNISQLKHQLSLSRGDPRATLINLQNILTIAGIGGGTAQNRPLEEAFQMLPASMYGSSTVDLKMSPGFVAVPVGGSSSGSSSSGSFLRESPSSSSRISRSVEYYTDRFQDRRQQMQKQYQLNRQHHPLQQATRASSSGNAVDQEHHHPPRRGCGDSTFASDPILAKSVPLQRPFDFDGGKKF
ncbi:UV radiation resistance-associated gene protein isoform X1 [Anopheles funestus]|uniref:UV radiation resistance-associated gene protein isoform X1 n=1 Tax=Anopheles funestus TaxID=62324 RepID=UPI0020C6D38A|nr:UV radiation resistance-associated gene protein isoform X1 [Anopheles funestus]XP_049279255.1 UV radiation resistance-associated gene protein isoform X1 [Anopheles funestus]